ncbi:TIR domain-containing protein [Novosphingobium sp. 1949]|uniref:TIR domain-containing protein n=1 Tax=Novosphingobium organovorum TaxID=2930092 RepID=A0ABT0BIA6_9SPHN|nr:toll/interleukin-1 receptor domain-containing protein [Novosphingobium organovorum]MCJ2184546.1 TIR domain-containing protein [Novosphingobium organovorum]
MSLTTDRSTVSRIQKDINDLQRKQAEEMKKVATATKKMNAAMASASRASSPSSAKTYLGTAEREAKNIDSAQEKSARYGADIAKKMSDLSQAQQRVLKGEEQERKKTGDLYEKQRKADEAALKRLADDNRALSKDIASLRTQMTAAIEAQASRTRPFVVENGEGRESPYDFFISHAWKDKEDFVNGLVSAAKDAGLDVWDDQSAISWGDSIRQKIDDGLRRAFFGVVVLSPSFFERPWTQYELDGIVQRDLSGAGRLLPIWHRLTQDDVATKAPSLAGRLALPTSTYLFYGSDRGRTASDA